MTNTLGTTPLMKRNEIRIIEKELLSLYEHKTEPLEILEWGSGGSTHHFTRFLEKHDIPYKWTSIEYNKRWFEKIQKEVADNKYIKMHLFDAGNDALKQRYTNMDEYVSFPKTLNKKFDFILVDGRKRRRCVLESKGLLSENGVVFLHDAQRPYYQCVFKKFPNGWFLGSSLWRGDLSTRKYVVLQTVNNFLWRLVWNVVLVPWHWCKKILRQYKVRVYAK